MTEPDNDPSPFARRGFIAAAVVVALVIVAAVVVIFTGGDDSAPAPVAGGTSNTAAPTTSAPADSGECDQPEGDQLPPVAAPVNDWELVGKLVAPTDPDGAGPGQVTAEGLRTCFSHDPTGALFAAVNWMGMTSTVEDMQLAVDNLTAPGPGADAVNGLLETEPDAVLGVGGYQISGFTFLTYTGDVAMLDLAVTTSDGVQGAIPLTLQWSDDDWLMQLPADGNFGAGTRPLDSLAGYVPWSGS
ncbi:hypothetical protein GCU67_20285 [Modestobacter muralis]|uniref:DUF8175 domain-containing protein n=1 Tax=Modestobacter muralis TaxID=1608614 RepID=A0A6P0HBX7_9ACTN|nr:hypothetical protein [Modestobacter muralis]NEK96488.1 hypothetical protein [Modestobacter muralis]NEN53388.1 hypothetical protein [Modestobacter muralis]